ncbi:MAG: phosphoribosylamine--glycine ligase [Verrucomicrobia bacterium]|mgnify:CR=1 FL=1|nr:phosphoribosylamine--glycine ligase [Verrucomicrobiota bacterium]
MRVLILGSGGREHAIAWKISQSHTLDQLFVAPGNPGTEQVGTNLNLDILNFPLIADAIKEHQIDLLVIGPEAPLVEGIVDFLRADDSLNKLRIIGPDKSGALLEGSKDFAKSFMNRYGIPTARHKSFSKGQLAEAQQFLNEIEPPYVLKADGLAAGKGVLIIDHIHEAKDELRSMLENQKFGVASSTVVIEEYLDGIEMSVFVLSDGNHYKLLPEAKDYKRIGEGDTGLNTGGMGAVSPVPFASQSLMHKIEEKIIKRTIEGLKADKVHYCGFIFIGLMIVDREPFVIEYNVRMGDPETEVVMPRIDADLLQLLDAAARGSLDSIKIKHKKEAAATVILVSKGYPESYHKGYTIEGLDNINSALIFHAGTKTEGESISTNGGRVLAVTSVENTLKEALAQCYKNCEQVNFEGKTFRKDIGLDVLLN